MIIAPTEDCRRSDSSKITYKAAAPISMQTRSSKKEFLQRYIANEKEIARLEEELESWESRAERVTACFNHICGGSGDDRLQYAVDMLCELRAALYDRLVDSTEIRLEIEGCLSQIGDSRLKLIMEYHYIDDMIWEDVAEKMHLESRWLMRLHNRALDMIVIPDHRL